MSYWKREIEIDRERERGGEGWSGKEVINLLSRNNQVIGVYGVFICKWVKFEPVSPLQTNLNDHL